MRLYFCAFWEGAAGRAGVVEKGWVVVVVVRKGVAAIGMARRRGMAAERQEGQKRAGGGIVRFRGVCFVNGSWW